MPFIIKCRLPIWKTICYSARITVESPSTNKSEPSSGHGNSWEGISKLKCSPEQEKPGGSPIIQVTIFLLERTQQHSNSNWMTNFGGNKSEAISFAAGNGDAFQSWGEWIMERELLQADKLQGARSYRRGSDRKRPQRLYGCDMPRQTDTVEVEAVGNSSLSDRMLSTQFAQRINMESAMLATQGEGKTWRFGKIGRRM